LGRRTLLKLNEEVIVPTPKKGICFKLEVDLINTIDEIWRERGFSSRSDFIREAIIWYIGFIQSQEEEASVEEVKKLERREPTIEVFDEDD